MYKRPLTHILEKIEFSEGLATLRVRLGRQLSLVRLINDYDRLKNLNKMRELVENNDSDLNEGH